MKVRCWSCAGVLALLCNLAVAGAETVTASPPDALPGYAALPLIFETNGGQAAESYKFLARGAGYQVLLQHAGPSFTVRPAAADAAVLRMHLVGAREAEPVAEQRLAGTVNVLQGSDRSQWRTGLATFAQVRYPDVYPGVDVTFHGHRNQLEYDFELAPGADPRAIHLALEGPGRLRLNAGGELVMSLPGGDLVQHAPRAYQQSNGQQQPVSAHYVLGDDAQVTFALGSYDPQRPLIIDPVLHYSTYLGGAFGNDAQDVAVDAAGNAYVVGKTLSADLPGSDPAGGLLGGDGTFVTKVAAGGGGIDFITYLSSTGNTDQSAAAKRAVAVDPAGNVYVTGSTAFGDFPTHNAFQSTCIQDGFNDLCVDAFVTKLLPDGTDLVYSTFLGGSEDDYSYDIAVDGDGNATIVGFTLSPGNRINFPIRNPLPVGAANRGALAFIARFSPAGDLLYSTFLGSGDGVPLYSVAVDGAGDAYVAGGGFVSDRPAPPGIIPLRFGPLGDNDGLLAKIEANGPKLAYLTYLGGSDSEVVLAVAVDADANAYVAGETSSADFPLRNNGLPLAGSNPSGFVAKLDPRGRSLIYATQLGGTARDHVRAIAVDADGHAWVTGQTSSRNFPMVEPLQPLCPYSTYQRGGSDACLGLFTFVSKLGVSGAALAYSTYFAGGTGNGIAVDRTGAAYVVGTAFGDVPLTVKNALQPVRPNDNLFIGVGYLAKFSGGGAEANVAPRPLLSLGDVDGDGSPDLAVSSSDGGAPMVTRIVHASDGALVRAIGFHPAFQPIDAAVLTDLNGNGAPELAVLERSGQGAVRVQVRDTRSGAWLGAVPFGSDLLPEHLAVLADLDGNGAPELAVQGLRFGSSGGARIVLVKDSVSGDSIREIDFDPFVRNSVVPALRFVVLGDLNGNGAEELAVLDRNRQRVQVRDAGTGEALNPVLFQQWLVPVDLAVLADTNGNGTAELAALGRGIATVAQTRDAGSADTLGTVYFGDAFVQHRLLAVPDLDGNGVDELAALGVSKTGVVKAEIKDAVSGKVVRNVWFGHLTGAEGVVVPDMNGNGTSELAVLGRNAKGALRVVIKDAATNGLISVLAP